MKFEGIDKIFENFEKEVNKKIDSISGEYSLSELFNNKFMRSHTSIKSLDEFYKLNNIQTKEDFENLPDETLDSTVRSISDFESFQDMLNQAATELVVDNWDK